MTEGETIVFTVLSEINWLAVVASTLVFIVLGGVYFGALVAKPYAVALDRQNAPQAAMAALSIVGPAVSSLAVVITSAVLLRALDVETLGDAVAFGLIVGIGYLVANTFTVAINPNIPRPLLYGLINAPYFIVCALATSIILTLWR